MLAVTRRKLSRADAVRAFLRLHPSTDPAQTALGAKLEEVFERASALIRLRGERQKAAKTSTVLRRRLRHRLQKGLLPLFSRAGLAAANGDGELEKAFRRIQPRGTALDFAAASRSLVETTRQHVGILAEHGVTLELVEQASSLLDQYLETIRVGLEERNARVKATAELREVAQAVMDVVVRIDRLIQHRFADDPKTLKAWLSAKDAVGPVVRRNGKPETPVTEAGPEPSAPSSGIDGDARAAA